MGSPTNDYNRAYADGLRAAALIAERMRDSFWQRGRACEASAADDVRIRIQYEVDHPDQQERP